MAAVAIDVVKVLLDGERGEFPVRISIVDEELKILLDLIVTPTDPVKDFRTNEHGITPETAKAKGVSFYEALKKVVALLGEKIVVGHDLVGDLKCCLLDIPEKRIRDTSSARMFKIRYPRGVFNRDYCEIYISPSLKELAAEHLNENIQVGMHSSVEDAIAIMKIYKKFKLRPEDDWMPGC